MESYGIDFARRSHRKIGDLNLTPMIDVLFILIIFFMLTTSFMRMESMELILPSAGGNVADSDGVVRVYLYENGELSMGTRKVDYDELSDTLIRLLEKDPTTKIMLLSAKGVTLQQLVNVMDRVYGVGGKSLFVRKWEAVPNPVLLSVDKEKAGL